MDNVNLLNQYKNKNSNDSKKLFYSTIMESYVEKDKFYIRTFDNARCNPLILIEYLSYNQLSTNEYITDKDEYKINYLLLYLPDVHVNDGFAKTINFQSYYPTNQTYQNKSLTTQEAFEYIMTYEKQCFSQKIALDCGKDNEKLNKFLKALDSIFLSKDNYTYGSGFNLLKNLLNTEKDFKHTAENIKPEYHTTTLENVQDAYLEAQEKVYNVYYSKCKI